MFPSSERPFSTRPLLVAWIAPLALFTLGGLPLMAFPGRTDVLVVCGLHLVGGVIASLPLLLSRIRVVDWSLIVQDRSLRSVRLPLHDLGAVSVRQPRPGGVPALEIITRDGTRASIRLGTWRREDELLAILAQAAERRDPVWRDGRHPNIGDDQVRPVDRLHGRHDRVRSGRNRWTPQGRPSDRRS
jgi:hypothetical protein